MPTVVAADDETRASLVDDENGCSDANRGAAAASAMVGTDAAGRSDSGPAVPCGKVVVVWYAGVCANRDGRLASVCYFVRLVTALAS